MADVHNIPTQELPRWMRQAQRGWDWGLVIALLLGLIAAWPFILQTGLPRTNSIENFVFLTDDFGTALQEGRLYPRWSSHTNLGYGAPVPSFYPPGAPYLSGLVKALFTNDPVLAARITFVLIFLLASSSTYALVRRHSGAGAGVLGAALYVFAPYFGHTVPYITGDMAVMLALGLAPAALWAHDRLQLLNQPYDLMLAGLLTAALIMSHPGTAAALLVPATIICLLRRTAPLRLLLALVIGTAIAALYWGPALLETSAIRWQTHPLPAFPTRITLAGLLTPLSPVDLGELVHRPQFTLGFVSLFFGAAGLATALIYRRHFHIQAALAATVLALIALVWFPDQTWLLGPLSLCLALVGSAVLAFRARLPAQSQRLMLAFLVALVFIASTPVWLAPHWPESFGPVSPLEQILYEQQGAGVAVLPAGLPVPLTTARELGANRFLLNGYQTGNINRIAPTSAPSNRQVSVLDHQTHADRFQIRLGANTRLEILRAYLPGWQAAVDGVRVPLGRIDATGLIYVDVPGTNGELIVSLQMSTIRQRALLLTTAALALLLLLTWRRQHRRPPLFDETELLTVGESRLLAVILATAGVIILLFAIPGAPLTLHQQAGHRLDTVIAAAGRTDAGIELVGYQLDRPQYRPGDTLSFTLYWRTIRILTENYQTQIYLINTADGTRWHRTNLRTPGFYPTTRWPTYRYLSDPYDIALSDTIVSGDYQIAVEVYACNPECATNDQLQFFNSTRAPVGNTFILPTLIRIAG